MSKKKFCWKHLLYHVVDGKCVMERLPWIDLNKMAVRITKKEGKKKSISIGQVKEVMKLVFEDLAGMDLDRVRGILDRYR